jgi:cytochrome c553
MPSCSPLAALCAGSLLLAITLWDRPAFAASAGKGRSTTPQPLAAAPPPGDAAAGKDKADAGRCFECHGVDGQGVDHGNATAVFARLAGQQSAYLIKQLRDFKSGARKHDVMRVMAQHLEDEDQRDIAAYFAALPPMHAASPGPAQSAQAAAGALLYARAAPAGGAPACATCHGEHGRGQARVASLGPVIAGQDARYLEQQLLDWRSGWRRNSPGGAMSQAASALSDADIRALSAYLGAQAAALSPAAKAAPHLGDVAPPASPQATAP